MTGESMIAHVFVIRGEKLISVRAMNFTKSGGISFNSSSLKGQNKRAVCVI